MTAPHILPLPTKVQNRHFWSVMIPTYNARADYLEKTLRSVLDQDPGPDQMQIEVVDDGSPDGAPVELVKRIAGDRVTIHCEPKNLGLARIWNRCIERAYGEWVHILHQDDMVSWGFYSSLRKGVEGNTEIAAAFSRVAFMNSHGNWLDMSELHRESAGILDNWHEKIAISQLIQCPAIAVRRSVYEQLGGFLSELSYTLDWEMWQRISLRYSFWFEPSVLAAYRLHPDSATTRLCREGADIREIRLTIDRMMLNHPAHTAPILATRARTYYAAYAVRNARRLLVSGQTEGAWIQISEAIKLSPNRRMFYEVWSFLWLRIRLARSQLKRRLFPNKTNK